MRKAFLFITLQLILLLGVPAFADSDFEFETLPIQNGGRLKPYDTFARETMMLLHGSSKFKKEGEESQEDKNQSRKASHVVATMLLAPEMWETIPFIRVDHLGLKEAMNLPADQKYFKPADLVRNPRLSVLVGDLTAKRQGKEKLNPFDQAAQRLESQLIIFHEIQNGGLRIAPNTDTTQHMWLALAELSEAQKEAFFKALRSYVVTFTAEGGNTPEKKSTMVADVKSFISTVQANNPSQYPVADDMKIEYHYNTLAPFQWAWVLYALAAVLMFLGGLFAQRIIYIMSWVSAGCAFLLHTYGFGLRVYITERPPVSNMYETVVWVAWGVIVFTAIFSIIKKKKYILLSGTMVAALCMIVADRAPIILDGTLQPLEPVLRSNLWLIIHVMTITLSYAAFFLALGISNVALFHVIRGEHINSPMIRDYVDTCYKTLQVGVVLLAAGTILGGVWADYSWGRFWGWDPKETWALIALLGYLALLHGRLAGLVKNFGMLAGSIIAFDLVMFAWYGVNFVLGAGLHSYGFGAGGIEWVAGYSGLQLIYVFFAYMMMLSTNEKELKKQK
ncbi:MAG: cytochrome c biogenesis protein CcsA [Bdellovibrionaceae bacterium]|nr:cytochrome c biogenesis protein CcsA [Pseudobdellovibrionaceae bacterium]